MRIFHELSEWPFVYASHSTARNVNSKAAALCDELLMNEFNIISRFLTKKLSQLKYYFMQKLRPHPNIILFLRHFRKIMFSFKIQTTEYLLTCKNFAHEKSMIPYVK